MKQILLVFFCTNVIYTQKKKKKKKKKKKQQLRDIKILHYLGQLIKYMPVLICIYLKVQCMCNCSERCIKFMLHLLQKDKTHLDCLHTRGTGCINISGSLTTS